MTWDSRECDDKLTLAALKINVKSLATEAKTNRLEASKLKGDDKWALNHHRTTVIRPEARAANLAYSFANGIPRAVAEPNRRELTSYLKKRLADRVRQKLTRLGLSCESLDDWLAG